MSQNDFTIANQGFPAFRADLNSALQALASNNSGATEPSTMFANMWWYDSSNNIMYIRNEDNDAWIKFAELDQANDKFVLSGTLQLDDGTVSAPALTFNSDTNMGIYRGGTDILKFVTAGTDAITIDANQRLGIGTGSPAQLLHLSSSDPRINIEDTDAGGIFQIRNTSGIGYVGTLGTHPMIFYTNGIERMRLESGGDISFYEDTGTTPKLFWDASEEALVIGASTVNANNAISLVPDGQSKFYTGGQTVLNIHRGNNDGDIVDFYRTTTKVGSIGATSGVLTIDGEGANTGGFYFNGANNILPRKNKAFNTGTIDLGAPSQRWKDLYLSGKLTNNGTGGINIDTSGNVGIGTSSPDYNLQVEDTSSNISLALTSSTSGFSRVIFGDSGSATIGAVTYRNSDNSMAFEANGSQHMLIDSGGHILLANRTAIPTTNGGTGFDPDTNGRMTLHIGSASTGAQGLIIFKNGNGEVGNIVTSGTSTAYNTSSDYRLKENVEYTFDATTRLKQLRPARFNFINDADTTVDGFLAHEVQSVVPEAVSGTKDATQPIGNITDADGNILEENVKEPFETVDGQTWTATGTEPVYQGIDQAKLVPLLVKTIQELEARIVALETA